MRSMMSMSSCKSWAFCAKDTQMYSTGGSRPSRYSASSMSFAVSAGQSISASGTLTPFLAFSFPPRTTFTLSSVSDSFSTTLTTIKPSSMRRSSPTLAAFINAFCSKVGFMVILPGRMLSLSSLQMPNSSTSPLLRGTGSPSSSATRNFGPCKSPRTSHLRPCIREYFLMSG